MNSVALVYVARGCHRVMHTVVVLSLLLALCMHTAVRVLQPPVLLGGRAAGLAANGGTPGRLNAVRSQRRAAQRHRYWGCLTPKHSFGRAATASPGSCCCCNLQPRSCLVTSSAAGSSSGWPRLAACAVEHAACSSSATFRCGATRNSVLVLPMWLVSCILSHCKALRLFPDRAPGVWEPTGCGGCGRLESHKCQEANLPETRCNFNQATCTNLFALCAFGYRLRALARRYLSAHEWHTSRLRPQPGAAT